MTLFRPPPDSKSTCPEPAFKVLAGMVDYLIMQTSLCFYAIFTHNHRFSRRIKYVPFLIHNFAFRYFN
jgi:hypothetical protein